MSTPRHWKTAPKTPWNPSRKATARVTNPLPVPEKCPHCGASCQIVNNASIYGREYGEWPWAVLCSGCRAYVGLHPFTGIPLGTLATAPIRKARSAAKDVFNPLWQSGSMTRSEAYAWLAGALGIANVDECHIGWFDVAQCKAVIAAVNARVCQ
ncbi:zinc-finger-containing protein [uncultured Rhodoferax sp.]|uniref:zinc-finger-containing protein n=1 Tax=uncultured Rhodoferax sp. TaxID=223188 RepID=UPI0025E8BF05|nr:zinc-finger-containing protein [uncultured Rhodoferax sp.]